MDNTAITYILNNIYQLHHLPGRILDTNGHPLALPSETAEEQDPVLCNLDLCSRLIKKNGQKKSYTYYNDDSYLYFTAYNKEKYIIWGPFVYEERKKHQNITYLQAQNVKNFGLHIPILNPENVKKIIGFAHGMITEEYETEVIFENPLDENYLHVKYAEYSLNMAEGGQGHFTFLQEQQLWNYVIEHGVTFEELNQEEGTDGEKFSDMGTKSGTMSESRRKHIEYNYVVLITLITRYAITSGVNDNEAYALSDVSLQLLSKAEDITAMHQIGQQCLKEFIGLAHKAKIGKKADSPYIMQCKQYVAEHIYEKISLAEAAAHVGVHPVYLSRIFSKEMEMTLGDYILKKKIELSCNLLKYSNRSIAIIAEYINLSPQSYFTKVFKKVTGETPAQYRKNHFDKKFLES